MSNIPRCEHPRPDRLRKDWLNLNGVWDFEIDNAKVGLEKNFHKRDSFSQKINVPFSPETVLSGIGHTDFMNAVWYRRNVDIPAEWAGKRVILHIDASDHTTRVFVNGKSVGEAHKGGYTSFSYDITDALSQKDNYITIYAEDDILSGKQFAGKQSTKLNSYGCFYTRTTGIWQTVWLEAVEAAHVLSYKVYPNISKPSVVIETATVGTQSDDTLCIKAYFEGKLMGSATTKMASATTVMEIDLAEAHLWECGNGRLYDLVFELTSGEKFDVMNGYFGLREVKLTKEKGLEINGETVFGRFVLDQGFNPEGVITAPSDEALKFDIEASMACGFNGARLHQKVFEPRFLYHADKLGYMLWDEAGNWGWNHTKLENIYNFLPEWLEEIERDRSHPSVIGWCPLNETWDKPDGSRMPNEVSLMIYNVTRAADPSRPVIANSGFVPAYTASGAQIGAAFDVHDYTQDPAAFAVVFDELEKGIIKDQLHRNPVYSKRQVLDTTKSVFVSEYGGIGWVENGDGWGYGTSVKTKEEFLERLEGLTAVLRENPNVCAFCYTQLYDVEQEKNGILTYERKFKFDKDKIKAIFGAPSVKERNK